MQKFNTIRRYRENNNRLGGIELLHPGLHVAMVADGVTQVLSLAALGECAEVVQVSVYRLQLKITIRIFNNSVKGSFDNLQESNCPHQPILLGLRPISLQ